MTGLPPAGAPPPGRPWPAALAPGTVTEVAPGVRRVVAPNPSLMTGPGTNTYLVGDDRLAVIDPGPDDDAHLEALAGRWGGRIAAIVVTHSHIDHSPLAVRLREATGAPVIGFGPPPAPPRPATRAGPAAHPATHPEGSAGSSGPGGGPDSGDPPGPMGLDPHDLTFRPERLLADGDHLDVGDARLVAVHTPGHASNHLCFELAGTGLMFSGDHVMSGSTVVIAPPDGDMTRYFESLEKVRALRPARIAPGHGDMIDDPAAVLDGYLRHRLEREAQVLGALQAAAVAGCTVDELVAAIYVEVPKELHPVARYSVWAHLRKLGAEGRAVGAEADDIAAPWWVAGADAPDRAMGSKEMGSKEIGSKGQKPN